MKRLLISSAFALCASSLAAQTTLRAGESSPVTLPLWNVLTMTGTGATCVQTRLSDTPGSGQSQGSNAISGSAVVTVGPYATVTRHTISCSVGSLVFDNAPAAFVVTGGLLASDIDASDTPADEECLTYEGTGPALEWQECGGSSGPADALAPAVVIEGATVNSFKGNFAFTDPTADWTWTWGATGNLTAGTAGTLLAPAFKLPGGTSGWLDDWGNGGLAGSFVDSTAFTLYSISAGLATARLLIDPDDFKINSGMKFGWCTIGGACDAGFSRISAGVAMFSDGNGGIRGLLGGGAAVASATAMPVPTGRVFHVTGTTTITSIASTNFQSGACVMLIFDDALTFTDGSNLKIAGDFVTTADDTISLCYDGTNWHEASRSVN